MKKWVLSLFAVFLISLLLASCYRPGTIGAERLYAVNWVVHRDVPVQPMGGADGIKFNEASVLKGDRYGRTLYSYTADCGLFDEEVTMRIVVQKEKGDFAYYYADDCYILKVGCDASFDAAEMEILLENNDWGKPVQEGKLSRTQYKNRDWHGDVVSSTDYLHSEKKLLRAYLGLQDRDNLLVAIDGLEVDAAKNQILLVTVDDAETRETIHAYWILYNADSEEPVLVCEEIVDLNMENIKESLRAFREKYFTSDGMY